LTSIAVWVKSGVCSADSLINILLCVLGYIPGLIHAWYIIAKNPEPPHEYLPVSNNERHGGRNGGVTYVYVQSHPQHPQQPQGQPKNGGHVNYGTNGPSSNATHQPQQQGVMDAGEGSSNHQGVPPSYAEVVAGDHKIQTRD
ncbi:hypothetical protein B0I35DRAFT_497211, partial [Stachybotrys elegans]